MADEIKENSTQKEKGKDKNKSKKKKEPGKVRRWFKDFFSELKKVTWPSFSKVLKQTGTVLLVTVCFLLVVLAFDSLLGYLWELLLGGLSEESVVLSALVGGGGGGLL
ncbi:MAG: preprotein translocase subunit SecE [Clostridiales bacterium]|nr:preprotein translocase subunit SecE [Clostridiales bacterium]